MPTTVRHIDKAASRCDSPRLIHLDFAPGQAELTISYTGPRILRLAVKLQFRNCWIGALIELTVGALEVGGFMARLIRTLDYLFGCHHSNLSRVFTIGGRTYRVCCACGAKFDFSLENMATGHRLGRRPTFKWLPIA